MRGRVLAVERPVWVRSRSRVVPCRAPCPVSMGRGASWDGRGRGGDNTASSGCSQGTGVRQVDTREVSRLTRVVCEVVRGL